MRATPALGVVVLSLALVACSGGWRSRAIDLPSLEGTPARPELLILISVAGLTPAAYRRPDTPMPVVAELARAGVSADFVEPVAPPTVYPAHATLVTGEPPSVHGIVADRVLGERGLRDTRFWHASHLRTATLWQRAADAERRVASLAWPSTLGASIELLIPDIAPPRINENWFELIESSSTPSVAKIAHRLGAAEQATTIDGAPRDRVLVGVACELVADENPPSLLLIRLSGPIPAISLGGTHSPAARAALGRADAQVGRLIGCLRKAGRVRSSAVAVVGDHGTRAIHTAIRANAILAQQGLVGDGPWRAIVRPNGGSGFVYARDERAAIAARSALEAEATRTGAFRIVSAEDMLRLEADPAAWFGLEAEPGFAFAPGTIGALLSPAVSLAPGGYLLQPEHMRGGLVAWGAGLRRGVRIPLLRQMDVAPTLAQLLGLDLGDVEGRALVGVVWPKVRRPAP